MFIKRSHPPERTHIPSLDTLGVQLHRDTLNYVDHPDELANALGGNGLKDIFANRIVFVAAFSACMGGLLFGFDQGILSIVLVQPQFLSRFPETDLTVNSAASFNKGIMTALLELGAFLGALQAGFVADRYSRKWCIGFGTIWFIIGSVIQAAAMNFPMLVVGRFVGGIGIGVLSSTAPIYISEIAPPNVRGAFLVLEGASIVIGIVIMFYITYGTRHIANEWAFRCPFTVQMAPCIVLAITLYRLPFSPRWLAQVGRDRDCLESLMRLRLLPDTDPRVQAEWILVRAEAIRNRETIVATHPTLQGGGFKKELKLELAAWIDMFKPGILPRTMIGIMLMFFQQFQGINALIYYSPTLFEQLGLDYEMRITMSGVLNICQMVGTCSAFFYLDRIGRKPPLLFGSFMNSISHFIVASMMALYSHDWPNHQPQAWTAVAFVLVFMFCFGTGWSPVPWAMPAEVHTASRRAKGVAIMTCSNWLFNFIIGLITPPMMQDIRYGTFIFFGVFSVLSGIWTWFFAPETKGMTLEDMDHLFKSHTAHDDMIAKQEITHLITGPTPPRHPSDGSIPEKGEDQIWVERV